MLGKRTPTKVLFSIFFFLTVTIVLMAVFFGMKGIRDQTRRDLRDDLQTVLSATQNALDIWVNETEKRVLLWANVKETKRNVASQLRISRSVAEGAARGALLKSESHLRLAAELNTTVKANGYLGYFIMDLQGRILSASHERLVGRDGRSLVGSLASAQNTKDSMNDMSVGMREPVLIPPFRQSDNLIPGQPILSVALAPVLSNGNAIAFLGFLLDPAENLTRTTQLGRLGTTGETYAFDQAGYLVTNSRFESSLVRSGLLQPGESAILHVQLKDPKVNLLEGQRAALPRENQPFTKMAESALKHQRGVDLDGYRDYRGVEVVGAWLWDPVLNLGLVTEIDVDEAYRSYSITRALVLVMLGLTLSGALAVGSALWLQSRARMKTVKSLERARQMLQESVQARNEFISIAAHELRTPLTSLRLQINLIHHLAEAGALCNYSSEKLLRMTRISSAEIERFSKIIRNLLDASQVPVSGSHLELQEFDLMSKLEDMRFQYLPQLEQTGCVLTVRGPASVLVRWDRSQMEQVLTNLLSNAIKYGKGAPIEIDVRESGQWIEVSVTDHGIGIKKEDQLKVFDKFERVGAINPEGGLGLGLYLARIIILRHSGTLTVKSDPGAGSTFTFKVPRLLPESKYQQAHAA
ncbi:MAG: sensor histidine kinase [Bdellovibrionia bacterium]